MKARLCGIALAFTLALPVQAQQGKAEAGAGGAGGIGIQIDVGHLLRGLGTLLGTAAPAEASPGHANGQIIAAWEDDAPIDAAQLAAPIQAQTLAHAHLTTLGLHVAVLQVAAEQTTETLEALRARHPLITFDRHALAEPLAGAPRHYAHRLVGASPPPAPLAQPVRMGVVDGDPGDATGLLHAAGLSRQVFGATAAGRAHATAVLCELACAADAGFPGLARGAELLVAGVLRRDPDGAERSDTFTLARALDWLAGQAAQVINISLGSAGDAVLARVVQRLQRRGIVLVAAAGNGGPRAPLPYPAAWPGVIAVAAVDAEAQPYARGSRGENVLVAAPGVDVWLPVDGGTYFTGTSYAAPFVTAWIAQRLARGASAGAAALCASARDLPPAGRDAVTGCGLLQFLP